MYSLSYNRPFDGSHNVEVALSENEFDTPALDSSGIMVHKNDGSVRTSGLKSWYSMGLQYSGNKSKIALFIAYMGEFGIFHLTLHIPTQSE